MLVKSKKNKTIKKNSKREPAGFGKNKSKRTFFEYSELDLKKALEMIKNGTPVATASKLCNVPRTTLRNKISGKTPETLGRVGPEPVLVRCIENKLDQ